MLTTAHRHTARFVSRITTGTLAGMPVVVAAARRQGLRYTVTVTLGAAALMPDAPGVTLHQLPVKGLAAAIRAAATGEVPTPADAGTRA